MVCSVTVCSVLSHLAVRELKVACTLYDHLKAFTPLPVSFDVYAAGVASTPSVRQGSRGSVPDGTQRGSRAHLILSGELSFHRRLQTDLLSLAMLSNAEPRKRKRSEVKSESEKATPFPKRCFNMLQDHENDSFVSWSADGLSFEVHRLTEFCDVTLPKYFNHSNHSSFVRQLNFYGFSKGMSGAWLAGETSSLC